jgi:hypothetical protein
MDWRWTARRVIVSAFLIFHLFVLFLWSVPDCAIRARIAPIFRPYMLPLGIWQNWAMFAPNPPRESYTVAAYVRDSRGMRHEFQFTRLADYSVWRGFPRFRHSKFATNMLLDEYAPQRAAAARYAVRQLGVPAEAFPVAAQIVYSIKKLPPPGSSAKLIGAPVPLTVDTITIEKIDEVRP